MDMRREARCPRLRREIARLLVIGEGGQESPQGGSCTSFASLSASTGVLEARARAGIPLTPFLSASAVVGASVVQQHDWMAGLVLSAHSRSHSGLRTNR